MLIRSPVNGYLDSFKFEAVVNNVAMNIGARICFGHTFIFYGDISRSKPSGS